jgi:DNA-binding cell septation regulator SpoVG
MAEEQYSLEVRVYPIPFESKVANVTCSIYFGGYSIEIKDVGLIKHKGTIFLAFPTKKYTKQGEEKYFQFLYLNKSLKDKFNQLAIRKYEAIKEVGEVGAKNPKAPETIYDGIKEPFNDEILEDEKKEADKNWEMEF